MDRESHARIARRVMFVISLAGLFVSTYLLITYLTNAPIVCGASHGCDIVRTSEWAKSFGLPRPLLGVVFYGGIIALLIFRTAYSAFQTRWAYRIMMIGVTIGVVESAFLTFVQWIDIKAFCIWCIASAVFAVVLFILAFWDKPTELASHTSAKELMFHFIALVVAFILGAIGIFFLTTPRTDGELPVITPIPERVSQ